MKRTLAALASAVGVEGLFLTVAAVLLSVFASYIHPAGPWLVTGVMALLIGIALAVPGKRG